MLILTNIRLLIVVWVTHNTVAVESGIIRHYYQIVQIHEETKEVKEWLCKNLVGVVSFSPMQKIPYILDGLTLWLKFRLVKCLNKAKAIQYFCEVIHWDRLRYVRWKHTVVREQLKSIWVFRVHISILRS